MQLRFGAGPGINVNLSVYRDTKEGKCTRKRRQDLPSAKRPFLSLNASSKTSIRSSAAAIALARARTFPAASTHLQGAHRRR